MSKFRMPTRPITGVLVVAGALFVGSVVGFGAAIDENGQAGKTETKTKTKTETVEVAHVPQSCLDALDAADILIDLGVDALEVNSDLAFPAVFDMLTAIETGDLVAMDNAIDDLDTATAELDSITGKINDAPHYGDIAADCRAES